MSVLLYVTSLPLLLPFPPMWAPLHRIQSLTPHTGCCPVVTRISHLVLGCHPCEGASCPNSSTPCQVALPLKLHGNLPHPSPYWAGMPPLFFSLLLGSESLYWSVLLISSSYLSGFSSLPLPPAVGMLSRHPLMASILLCVIKSSDHASTLLKKTFRRKILY